MIEVHDLRKEYVEAETPTLALRDVTFTIAKGEFVSIMGPSGSGKSTLLRLLTREQIPSSARRTASPNSPPMTQNPASPSPP